MELTVTGRKLRLLIISPSKLVSNCPEELDVGLLLILCERSDEGLGKRINHNILLTSDAGTTWNSDQVLTYDIAPVAFPAS